MGSGCRLDNAPVAFDSFRYYAGVRYYFLTHLHADHTAGLMPSWNLGTIVCSEVTKRLLIEKFSVDEAVVATLPIGEPSTLPLDDRGNTMTVTLLDANHCPGAVMVLLDGYFGRVLHTGDFRFCEAMLQQPALATPVDLLFLDNSYCSPEHDFPPREVVAQDILQCIVDFGLDGRPIYIGIDTLGKEELLVFLAESLSVTVGVDARRYRALQLLDIGLQHFTYDVSQADIRVVSRQELSLERGPAALDGEPDALYILPTSLYKILPIGNRQVQCFPYSLHSSFPELQRFVAHVRPCAITPIVRDRYADVERHFGHLLRKARLPAPPPPPAVAQAMRSASTLALKQRAAGGAPPKRPSPAQRRRTAGQFVDLPPDHEEEEAPPLKIPALAKQEPVPDLLEEVLVALPSTSVSQASPASQPAQACQPPRPCGEPTTPEKPARPVRAAGDLQCQWEGCLHIEPDTLRLLPHITRDHVPASQPGRKREAEFRCRWRNCDRDSTFAQRGHLIRHISQVHLRTLRRQQNGAS